MGEQDTDIVFQLHLLAGLIQLGMFANQQTGTINTGIVMLPRIKAEGLEGSYCVKRKAI